KVVGARLDDEIDGRTGVPPRFGRPARLNRELIDRFDWQQRPGNAGHATLIDRGDVLKRIVVVGAVDLKVVASRPVAIHRVAGDARGELQHPGEVTAVERQI